MVILDNAKVDLFIFDDCVYGIVVVHDKLLDLQGVNYVLGRKARLQDDQKINISMSLFFRQGDIGLSPFIKCTNRLKYLWYHCIVFFIT